MSSITSQPGFTLTRIASGTVAGNRLVDFSGAQAATKGMKVLGVASCDAVNQEPMAVHVSGVVLVTAGAAITAGASLITDTQGRAIPVTGNLVVASGATAVTSSAVNGAVLTGADLPEFVFGDAMEAASGAGVIIQVLLRR